MSSIDEQFVEYIVKSLVSKPDAVKLERRIDEKGVLLELTVDPEDLGRVIGKRGATAQSLRILLRALGTKNDARYNLKIIDNGVPRPDRAPRSDDRRDDYQQAQRVEEPKAEEPKAEEPEAPVEAEEGNVAEEQPEESEPTATAEEPEAVEEDHDSVVSKTRRELEDLDDLDI